MLYAVIQEKSLSDSPTENRRATRKEVGADLLKILPKLRYYALRLTRDKDRAEDLLQRVFLKLIEKPHTFIIGTNFAAFSHRVMRNEFISDLRKIKRNLEDAIEIIPEASLSHPPSQESADFWNEFRIRIKALSNEQRIAVEMAVLEGLPYDEIAKETGVAVGTVKSRISRARALLGDFLK